MRSIRLLGFLVALGCPIGAVAQVPKGSKASTIRADDWVTVRAYGGVVVRLPAHWKLQGGSANARQAARGNKIVDLTRLPQRDGAVAIQADDSSASVTVSIVPGRVADQTAVATLTPARVASIDADFRSDLAAGMKVEGAKLIRYGGTSKEQVGSLWSLVTRYTYQMPGRAPRAMESHRIFLGTQSIGLMLQSAADAPKEVRETLRTVRESFIWKKP